MAMCHRYLYNSTFSEVQERNLLSIPMGFSNTLVLLFSSLTMALAVREAQLTPIKVMKAKEHRGKMIKYPSLPQYVPVFSW